MRELMNLLPKARFRLEKAFSRATRVTGLITGTPACNTLQSPVERGYEQIEAARDEYQALYEELEALRAEAAPVIDTLENELERTAMRMRYIEGMSVTTISYRLAYSEKHIFRTLKAAEMRIMGG